MEAARLYLGTRRYSSWSLRGWLMVRLAGLVVEETVFRLQNGNTPEVKHVSPGGTVPVLVHDGATIWESLAIAEYCAELHPALWPAQRVARAHARSVANEMHAGFRALRRALPMNLGRTEAAPPATGDVRADIDRIEALWRDCRARFGASGPFLFGAEFNAADAMFVPVVLRLLGYQVPVSAETEAYCRAVRAHPLVTEWYDASMREDPSWRDARYETLP